MKLTRPRLDAEVARRLDVRGKLQFARCKRARSQRVIGRVLMLLLPARMQAANDHRWRRREAAPPYRFGLMDSDDQ